MGPSELVEDSEVSEQVFEDVQESTDAVENAEDLVASNVTSNEESAVPPSKEDERNDVESADESIVKKSSRTKIATTEEPKRSTRTKRKLQNTEISLVKSDTASVSTEDEDTDKTKKSRKGKKKGD